MYRFWYIGWRVRVFGRFWAVLGVGVRNRSDENAGIVSFLVGFVVF
jgi:hypothetical protein